MKVMKRDNIKGRVKVEKTIMDKAIESALALLIVNKEERSIIECLKGLIQKKVILISN